MIISPSKDNVSSTWNPISFLSYKTQTLDGELMRVWMKPQISVRINMAQVMSSIIHCGSILWQSRDVSISDSELKAHIKQLSKTWEKVDSYWSTDSSTGGDSNF